MATQTMGQLYCGSGFGKRWNRAWANAVDAVFSPVWDLTVDKLPQELFEQLLATAFWKAADVLGGVPKQVLSLCDAPDRPTETREQLTAAAVEWRKQAGL